MREKKSRAWDKVTETHLYSDKFPSMWQFYKELENRGIRHWETEDYTGLKDKNGKEIYEGDILKWIYPAGYSLAEVRFGDFDNGEEYEDNDSGIGWYIKEQSYFNFKDSERENVEIRIHGFKGYPLSTYKHEVIGNISANKELLNVKS